ncbi:DUF1203 domain-containing protein [Pollutibacter soli]|uniref:DUF1203 domain-containing protein n=1 Tax=Pollutibacter soli TaxID=3034157 RepID=UPI00301329F4
MINFQITPLDHTLLTYLFELDEKELQHLGAVKMTADRNTGYPCRISLTNAGIGEEVILLHYKHHQTDSPYQASGPIFIRNNVKSAKLEVNEIPAMLTDKLLSIRSYTNKGMLRKADVIDGKELRQALITAFTNAEINYIHIHSAKEGCYHCTVNRTTPEHKKSS